MNFQHSQVGNADTVPEKRSKAINKIFNSTDGKGSVGLGGIRNMWEKLVADAAERKFARVHSNKAGDKAAKKRFVAEFEENDHVRKWDQGMAADITVDTFNQIAQGSIINISTGDWMVKLNGITEATMCSHSFSNQVRTGSGR